MMIQLSLSLQNLCKVVFPTPSSAEIIGMPREATSSADDPDIIVMDKEHLQWDFKPWLQEKTNDVRLGFEGLLEYYEKDPKELKLAPGARVSSEQFVQERLVSEIQTIIAYTEAILSMFESGRLMVRDVKLKDED